MIEIVVLNFLSEILKVPVYMEMPEKQPKEFVLIEKVGSSVEDHIYSVTLALQSYAESLYEAAVLNEEVKKAMDDIVILDSVSRSQLNSDYNFTDTTKKKYRYQAVYDLVY